MCWETLDVAREAPEVPDGRGTGLRSFPAPKLLR